MILDRKISASQDVWSFGCLVYEFVTGNVLFWIDPNYKTDDELKDQYFLTLSDRLGPLPDFVMRRWPRAHVYFNEKKEQIKYTLDANDPDFTSAANSLPLLPTLEESFDREKPPGLGSDEANEIKGLLRWILQYDEKLRPSPAEILQHPWFASLNR